MVFFDNIDESIRAAEHVQKHLPPKYHDRDNTAKFWEGVTMDFLNHKMCGLFCADTFGMVRTIPISRAPTYGSQYLQGIDIPVIELVVLWQTVCGINAMWQHIGRAA